MLKRFQRRLISIEYPACSARKCIRNNETRTGYTSNICLRALTILQHPCSTYQDILRAGPQTFEAKYGRPVGRPKGVGVSTPHLQAQELL